MSWFSTEASSVAAEFLFSIFNFFSCACALTLAMAHHSSPLFPWVIQLQLSSGAAQAEFLGAFLSGPLAVCCVVIVVELR